jgi:hypothetical protein
MKLDANGVNEHGVAMCACKPGRSVHAWEPGEWCSPRRVLPPTTDRPASSSPSKSRALEGAE